MNIEQPTTLETLELLEIHKDTVQKLYDRISKLPRFSQECNCDGKWRYYHIHLGDYIPEVICFCIKCGGYVDEG